MNPTLQRDFALFFSPFMAINRAHVVMLVEREILTETDGAAILRGLEAVEVGLTPETLGRGSTSTSMSSGGLQHGNGALAGRMHTARSRNDLQACYQRMAVRVTLEGCRGRLTLRARS